MTVLRLTGVQINDQTGEKFRNRQGNADAIGLGKCPA
jgi:hypothetical protein